MVLKSEENSYEKDLEMQGRRKILWTVRLQLVMWIICILLILHYTGLAPFGTWVDRFKTFADSWFSLYVIVW